MYEAFQIVAGEIVKKDALNQSMNQRQTIMALVQSKRHSSVGISGRKESTVTRTGDFGAKTRQTEKLSQLEAKYSKVVAR